MKTDKRPLSTNLLKFKINPNPNPISTNDSIKLIPNTNKFNIKQSQSTINLDKNNMINNNRYNLKDIDELEEFELSKIDKKKTMNKNFSAFELKGINSFNNMSILFLSKFIVLCDCFILNLFELGINLIESFVEIGFGFGFILNLSKFVDKGLLSVFNVKKLLFRFIIELLKL